MIIDLQKHDRIVLTWAQQMQIEQWAIANTTEYLKEYAALYDNLPFKQGVVVIKNVNDLPDATSHDVFSYDEATRTVTHKYYENDTYLIDFMIGEDGTADYKFYYPMDEEMVNALMSQVAQYFYCLMKYVSSGDRERVHVQRVETKKTSKKGGTKTKVRKVITINSKIVIYDGPPQKRPVEWKTESWGVRGHWRQYSTGKRAWVKPYTKGNGMREATEYRI